jgi:hypothetical protein
MKASLAALVVLSTSFAARVDAADTMLLCNITLTQGNSQSTVTRKLAFYYETGNGVEYQDNGRSFDKFRDFSFTKDDEFYRLGSISIVLSEQGNVETRGVFSETVIDRGSGDYQLQYHYHTTTYKGPTECFVGSQTRDMVCSRSIVSQSDSLVITARGHCARAPKTDPVI